MAEPEVVHEIQVTPAHVYELVRDQVIPRLDTLEGTVAELKNTVDNAGLNGHTPLLKAFLEQYGATYVKRQAWQTVRSDIAHRFRFLRQPKSWVRTFFIGLIGALAWQIGSQVFRFHVPDHLFHFLGF